MFRDSIDDPLDDQASLTQQLEQLSVICRCEYEKTARLLLSLFDRVAGEYQQALSEPGTSANDANASWRRLCEGGGHSGLKGGWII